MSSILNSIKTLEKLSLVTCSKEVLPLLDRALENVKGILEVDTKGLKPLLWQNELDIARLHSDKANITLDLKAIKQNAAGFHEDYISVGLPPKTK